MRWGIIPQHQETGLNWVWGSHPSQIGMLWEQWAQEHQPQENKMRQMDSISRRHLFLYSILPSQLTITLILHSLVHFSDLFCQHIASILVTLVRYWIANGSPTKFVPLCPFSATPSLSQVHSISITSLTPLHSSLFPPCFILCPCLPVLLISISMLPWSSHLLHIVYLPHPCFPCFTLVPFVPSPWPN